MRCLGDCWLWDGAKNDQGYGQVRLNGKTTYVHRLSYTMSIGEIPKGLQLDHLCRTPLCFNPQHLEPVTSKENTMRGLGVSSLNAKKTHCKHGHLLSGNNLVILHGNKRNCRECKNRINREWNKRKRGVKSFAV